MKDSQLYVICSAIYIAPHLNAPVGIFCGLYLACFALYCGWKKS